MWLATGCPEGMISLTSFVPMGKSLLEAGLPLLRSPPLFPHCLTHSTDPAPASDRFSY